MVLIHDVPHPLNVPIIDSSCIKWKIVNNNNFKILHLIASFKLLLYLIIHRGHTNLKIML